MNAKKCKQLRKLTCEQSPVDWPEVEYGQTNVKNKLYKVEDSNFLEPKYDTYQTWTTVLTKCKRKFYKECKKSLKKGLTLPLH